MDQRTRQQTSAATLKGKWEMATVTVRMDECPVVSIFCAQQAEPWSISQGSHPEEIPHQPPVSGGQRACSVPAFPQNRRGLLSSVPLCVTFLSLGHVSPEPRSDLRRNKPKPITTTNSLCTIVALVAL